VSPTGGTGRIAIWTGNDPLQWSAADIDGRAVGGTEIAVTRMAEELCRLGFDVTVYGNVEPCTHEGARFAPAGEFDPADAPVIWVRMPDCAAHLALPPRSIVWAHDRNLGEGLGDDAAVQLDAVLAKSRWQLRLILERHPVLADRAIVVPNGVEVDRFAERDGGGDRAPRVLFTSQPERGLDVMLELWPRVRERVPDAEMAYAYAPIYATITDVEWVGAHRERIERLSGQPGVRPLGSLSRDALAELMRDARVWAHPSWATAYSSPFDETSCVAAMEAQAAGLWVVASAWGALPETVRVGALVDPDGAPGEPWRSRLVEEIVAGLTDPDRQRRARADGPAAMRDQRWSAAARSVAAAIGNGAG
jgi:glycosyltransferase involved in cell wall biosynthesis